MSRLTRLLSFLLVSSVVLMPFAVARSQVYPPGFNDELVVDGFDGPTTFVFLPDGRILVGEQDGTIWIVENGVVLPTPLIDLPADTTYEQGLLGMAVHPDWPSPEHLFVNYSIDPGIDTHRISRLTLSGNTVTNETILFEDVPLGGHYHVGGCLRIGVDRKLYLSMGDGGDEDDAQDLSNFTGTLMRFNLDGSVPSDNPYVGVPNVRPEIYQYGLRNPFRFSVQPGTGAIFIGDVGYNDWEEINTGPPMANFGWPEHEGPTSPPDPTYTDPFYAYEHSSGSASVSGNTFYTGTAFPAEYMGNFFFFDHSSGELGRIEMDGNNNITNITFPWIETTSVGWGNGPTELREGPDGALYYATYDPGTIRRIYYDNPNNTNPTAVAAATPIAGYAPLDVDFDAAASFDPDGDNLTYSWDFGDGSGTGTGESPSHTYAVDGTYDVVLTADDGQGGTHQAPPITITVGTLPPVVTISTPTPGQTFLIDDVINFVGFATDPDDGPVDPNDLHWQVYLVHLNHIHPIILDQVGSGGSFVAGGHGENPGDIHYEITAWTVDSDGVRGEATVAVVPDSSLLGGPAPQITSIPPLTGTANVLYNYVAQATGGTPTWSLLAPPSWLAVDGVTGVVSGVPPTAGSYDVRLRAQNPVGLHDQLWTISVAPGAEGPVMLVPMGANWNYMKGTHDPGAGWTDVVFDDSGWLTGPSGFGYGDDDDTTELLDMEDNYSTVFTRHCFQILDPAGVESFSLLTDYDDGLAVFLNGTMIFDGNAPDPITFDSFAPNNHEADGSLTSTDYSDAPTLALFRQGTNCLAAVGFNTTIGSSDFTLQVAMEITGGLDPSVTDVGDVLYDGVHPARPNPFDKRTAIRFALSEPGAATLQVFDANGRLVRSIRTPTLSVGTHSLSWDGRRRDGVRAPAGVYFYRLQAGTRSSEGKIIRIR